MDYVKIQKPTSILGKNWKNVEIKFGREFYYEISGKISYQGIMVIKHDKGSKAAQIKHKTLDVQRFSYIQAPALRNMHDKCTT